MKDILRLIVAPWYLLGWISHVYLALSIPETYRGFGSTALIPAFGQFWESLIMPNIVPLALALAAFELTVGLLLIGRGRQVTVGLALSILFNLFLVQLGLSGQATDWTSDFLMNRMPNLILVAAQVPLLFCTFDQSLAEVISPFFRRYVQWKRPGSTSN